MIRCALTDENVYWLPKLDVRMPKNETNITKKLQQVVKPSEARLKIQMITGFLSRQYHKIQSVCVSVCVCVYVCLE